MTKSATASVTDTPKKVTPTRKKTTAVKNTGVKKALPASHFFNLKYKESILAEYQKDWFKTYRKSYLVDHPDTPKSEIPPATAPAITLAELSRRVKEKKASLTEAEKKELADLAEKSKNEFKAYVAKFPVMVV